MTSGAGRIVSHICVKLLNAGMDVTVFDNSCNSYPCALALKDWLSERSLYAMCLDPWRCLNQNPHLYMRALEITPCAASADS